MIIKNKKIIFSTSISIIILAAFCVKIISQNLHSPTLHSKIQKITNQSRYKNSFWWIFAKDLDSGNIIYSLNKNKMLMPGSVTKLFSVASLLNDFGYNYRFKTPVYSFGKLNKNGIFNGNLVLVGKGDLTLGSRKNNDHIQFEYIDHTYANVIPGASLVDKDPLSGLNILAKQIAKHGIKQINGNILIDNRAFEIFSHRDYILSPLMINENFIDFKINPTALNQPASISTRPNLRKLGKYKIINQTKTTKKNQLTNIEVTFNSKKETFYVKGNISIDSKDIIRVHKISNPTSFARLAFVKSLEKAGIKLNIPNKQTSKELPSYEKYNQLKPIATLNSAPLYKYSKLILKTSHNPGADLIPLLIASNHKLKTFDDGMHLIGKFLTNKVGINKDDFVFLDAGGGNNNRATPNAILKLLDYIYKLPKNHYEKFYKSLPILGIDGSLAKSGLKSPAKGKIHAKTGTSIVYDLTDKHLFSFSEALGGYIDGKNRNTIAFITAVSYSPMKNIKDALIIQNDVSKIASTIYNHSNQY